MIVIRKNQTEKYWSNVLGDLLKIGELCFSSLSSTICYEVKVIYLHLHLNLNEYLLLLNF